MRRIYHKYLSQVVWLVLASAIFGVGFVGATGWSIEGGFCPTCSAKSLSNHNDTAEKIPIQEVRSKKHRRHSSSWVCPQGHRAIHRRCPQLESTIRKIVGAKNTSCYSNLFGVEGGCSIHVRHDPKKAHNPHVGVGLCAIEASPVVRRNNNRGPDCAKVSTLSQQIKCCRHLMVSTHGKYFGTVKCGNTPRCY